MLSPHQIQNDVPTHALHQRFFLKWLKGHGLISHAYILLLSVISFVIFDAGTLRDAVDTIGSMFGFGAVPLVSAQALYYLKSFAVVFLIAILGATPLLKNICKRLYDKGTIGKIFAVAEPVVMILLLLLCTGYLVDGSFNPFLYFRF